MNNILTGDCLRHLAGLSAGTVDLVFADPPFNIGYEYDVYDDRQKRDDYLAWCRRWIQAVYRGLKASGTFWLAIGDERAAELKLLSQEIGFHCRSWVIWYYTFGVNCTHKFSRSHAHLLYFVKDPATFTFREDDPQNRVPSARQLVYADRRANPRGRLPDDTWILRPQDMSDCFTADEDTWYFPRVAGTFKERAGFHGCQISEEYALRGNKRLEQVQSGDSLRGAADPLTSCPSTANGKRRRPEKRGQRHIDLPAEAGESAAGG